MLLEIISTSAGKVAFMNWPIWVRFGQISPAGLEHKNISPRNVLGHKQKSFFWGFLGFHVNEGYIWFVTLIFRNLQRITHRSSKYMYLGRNTPNIWWQQQNSPSGDM